MVNYYMFSIGFSCFCHKDLGCGGLGAHDIQHNNNNVWLVQRRAV